MLVSPKKLLAHAKQHNYAIPAPDFIDSNSARAYIEVAEIGRASCRERVSSPV